MNRLSFLGLLAVTTIVCALSSCETLDRSPKPERERLSSMPQNIPQPWEGQAGLPGMAGGGY